MKIEVYKQKTTEKTISFKGLWFMEIRYSKSGVIKIQTIRNDSYIDGDYGSIQNSNNVLFTDKEHLEEDMQTIINKISEEMNLTIEFELIDKIKAIEV